MDIRYDVVTEYMYGRYIKLNVNIPGNPISWNNVLHLNTGFIGTPREEHRPIVLFDL